MRRTSRQQVRKRKRVDCSWLELNICRKFTHFLKKTLTHADTYNIIPKCDKRQVKCVPIAPGFMEYSFEAMYSTHSALCGQAVSDISA